MAKTVNVVITDDLDGSPDAQTVAFSFGGHSYEIDLGPKNLAKLQKSLQPFIDAGRRTARPQGSEGLPGPPGPGRTGRRCARGLLRTG